MLPLHHTHKCVLKIIATKGVAFVAPFLYFKSSIDTQYISTFLKMDI